MKRYLIILRIGFLSLLMMALQACSAPQDQLTLTPVDSLPTKESTLEPEQTPTPLPLLDPEQTPTPAPTPTSTQTQTSSLVCPSPSPTRLLPPYHPGCQGTIIINLPVVTDQARYEGWYEYTNRAYRFSFYFPQDWLLVESKNRLCLITPFRNSLILLIMFKRTSEEDVVIQRTGVGGGEIITRGAVKFFDQEIAREILVYKGKDKELLYNYGLEIKVNDLVFTINLSDVGYYRDYETFDIAEQIQDISDSIVESFVLTEK